MDIMPGLVMNNPACSSKCHNYATLDYDEIVNCGDGSVFGGACASCSGNGGQHCRVDEDGANFVGACDGATAGGRCVDLTPFAADDEARALTVFYLSTDKPDWVGSDASGKCSWQGVTCTGNNVTEL